jgi:hypothetical protein
MTSLIEHARYELKILQEDPEIAEAIIDVIHAFVGEGLAEDGVTAATAATYIHHLLRRKPLSPLTSDPQEWARRENDQGAVIWQSLRDPEAFSQDGGKNYWLLSDGAGMVNDEGGVDRIMYPSANKADLVHSPGIADLKKMEDQSQ